MTCHRCRTSDCPGCPVEVDCSTCGRPIDLEYTDSRRRCPDCTERAAMGHLPDVADVTVQPEVIRVAVAAARADERHTVIVAIVADILAGAESLEREASEMSEATHPGGRSLRMQNATVWRYLAGRILRGGAVSP